MATGAFSGKGSIIQRAGVAVAEVINFDGPSGKNKFDDATNMDSGADEEFIPTTRDNGSLSFNANFLGIANASQAQLISDFNNQTLSPWTVVFPGGRGQIDFSGYVEDFSIKAAHDKKVEFSSKLKVSGAVVIS